AAPRIHLSRHVRDLCHGPGRCRARPAGTGTAGRRRPGGAAGKPDRAPLARRQLRLGDGELRRRQPRRLRSRPRGAARAPGREMDAVSGARPAPRGWTVRQLGRQPYEPVWRAMQAYTDGRDGDSADELWLVEPEPVLTLGQAGRWEHVLAPGDIPVVPVDRGGQVTYHGPGQLVAYPLVDLRRLGIGVRALVERIEQAVIDTLATWSIASSRRDGAPGVYVGQAKVMALGL